MSEDNTKQSVQPDSKPDQQHPDNMSDAQQPAPKPSNARRPDFKSMPQPLNASQRMPDRVSVRPGGHVSLRPGGVPSQRPSTGTFRGEQSGTMTPYGGTLVPQHPKPDTMRPTPSQRPAVSSSYATGRSQTDGSLGSLRMPIADESFSFEGKVYKRDALLSSTTGEAEIFLVSLEGNQYVLKLYYPGYYPSTDVLNVLKSNAGNGLVVDILAYGVWTSKSGEERFGVLMPFYSGGVLKGGEFRGQPKALERIATQAMESIKYCHDHGILHKDVKPNNFIYADKSQQRIVLADFGIASIFTRDLKGKVIPFVNVNQNRTYIYASPEIFNLTVQRNDGKVEVEYTDVKSDFFALGMTLLVLWMGEAPFALLDERSLLKLKRGDRSGLPYPEDIPRHTRNLIKGLTIADPKQRWGFEEFEKWQRGDDEPVESLNNNNAKGFRILYNGSKNQIATSIRQLAEFMLDDPALGEQYLYSGKISKWMTDAGMPEWQMRIDSIVNKQYPKSRHSGLLATCYKMNPDLPFVGIKGQKCYNNLQIARELTRNADQYSMALRDWDAPLYIYFASHSIDTGTKYQQLFKSNPWLALWRLAFAISPQCEFPFWNTTRNALVWCASVEDLIQEYASSSQDRYAAFNVRTPIGKYTPMLLEDECFITWLDARDPVLAEKVKTALANEKSHGSELYTYIFFLLDPARNFFFEPTTETFFSVAHLGSLINHDLIDYLVIGRHNNNQHFYDEQHRRCEQLSHYRDTKLYYYFKSRGGHADKFEYIDRCFDLHSKENRAKAGPYTSKLATLKVCHAFAGESFYYFPISDITVSSVEQLDEVPIAEQQEELHRGFLLEWLAVQFQENPALDTSTDEYAYERETLKFMEAVSRIDSTHHNVVTFNKCRDVVEANASKVRLELSKIKRLKGVLLSFAALVAVMIVVLLWGGVHNLPNDDTFNYNWRTVAYLAVPLFVLMVIPPIQTFVNDITRGFLGSPILFAAVVSNVIVLGWEVLRLYIMPYAHFSMPALYGLFLILILYCCFFKRGLKRRRYMSCIYPDFKTAYAEPLFFTWRDSNDPYKEFDSSVMMTTKEYGAYLKAIHRKLKGSVKLMSVWLVILTLGFCLLSIPVSNAIYTAFPWLNNIGGRNAVEQYDNPDKVMLYICDVDTALSVRETPNKRARVLGTLNDGDLVEVVGFEGDYARILFDGNVAYVLKSFLKPLE